MELRCPRCGVAGEGYRGCPGCRRDGVAVNLVPPFADLRGRSLRHHRGGPWGWPETLPTRARHATQLGEGNTPSVLIASARRHRLWVKDESRNPTGSHKDRAMSVNLAKALEPGASTVVAASSGNAGASAAAYAARAGLRCVVLTTPTIPRPLVEQIAAFGAVLAEFEDAVGRDDVMAAAVTELGWYPVTNFVRPPSGGNPFGNEGYKSVAYELARDVSDIDTVVIPTSRADLLAGVERGYNELVMAGLVPRIPRLVAAETVTGAAFSNALTYEGRQHQERADVNELPSPAFSLGSSVPSWQGLHAIWNTGGGAIAIEVDEYVSEHRRLPREAGLYLEVSSAVGVAAARRLLDAGEARSIVAIGTATGLKGNPLERGPARPCSRPNWTS